MSSAGPQACVCLAKSQQPIAVKCVNVTFAKALGLDGFVRLLQITFEGYENWA